MDKIVDVGVADYIYFAFTRFFCFFISLFFKDKDVGSE